MTIQLPKVSIAIITYNQENFIEECVLSALAQEYENLEVLVADDGSTDRTTEILKNLKEIYGEKLVLDIGGPNLGISGNTNRALNMCSGDYICILGGDDVLIQGKIKTQLSFMIHNPDCVLSYHQVEAFNSGESGLSYYFTSKFLEGDADTLIENGMFFLPIATMFKSGYLAKNPVDNSIPRAGDWMLYVDLLHLSGQKLMFAPGVYARYRRHKDNVTNSKDFSESWVALEKMLVKMPQRKSAITRSMARQAISDFYANPKNYRRLILNFTAYPKTFISKFLDMVIYGKIARIKISRLLFRRFNHVHK